MARDVSKRTKNYQGGVMQQSMMPDYVNDKFTNNNVKDELKKLYRKNPRIFDKSNDDIMLEYWLENQQLADVLGDKLPQFIKWWKSAMKPSSIDRAIRFVRDEEKITKKSKRYLENESHHYWKKD